MVNSECGEGRDEIWRMLGELFFSELRFVVQMLYRDVWSDRVGYGGLRHCVQPRHSTLRLLLSPEVGPTLDSLRVARSVSYCTPRICLGGQEFVANSRMNLGLSLGSCISGAHAIELQIQISKSYFEDCYKPSSILSGHHL